MKTLSNTDAKGAHAQVPDLEIWGDGDMFKLLCKASSGKEGWMKSTKAMAVPGLGVVVQVTTQQREDPAGKPGTYAVAEAVCFVPSTYIIEHVKDGKVVGRRLGAADVYDDNSNQVIPAGSVTQEHASDEGTKEGAPA